jgi:D-alanine-D-alanine ligase-like ATP-grasp enzyme
VGQTVYEVNPLIKTELIRQIEADTLAMHKAIGVNFVSRCDFLVNTNQTDYVFLEINTHPGFTQTSLIPKLVETNSQERGIFDSYHNPNTNLNFYDKMVDMILLNAIVCNV